MINNPASVLPHGIYIVVGDTLVDSKQVISDKFAEGNKQFDKESRITSVSQDKIIPERGNSACKGLKQDKTWRVPGTDRKRP